MGTQRLGEKAVRRIERTVGEPVLRAWAQGGYTFWFTTPDHRHGWYSKKTGEWAWEEGRIFHVSSCSETWPGFDRNGVQKND